LSCASAFVCVSFCALTRASSFAVKAATIAAWTSATFLPCAVITAASVVPFSSFASALPLRSRAFADWRRMNALTCRRLAACLAFAAFLAFAA
jgi:hypothetical protein